MFCGLLLVFAGIFFSIRDQRFRHYVYVGAVGEGQSVRQTFSFRNWSMSYLEVDRISTSCGCTKAMSSRQRIPPLGVYDIELQLSTSGTSGHKIESATIHYANATKQVLRVAADVVQDRPATLSLGDMMIGESGSLEFLIRSVDRSPLKVHSIDFEAPIIDVEEIASSQGNEVALRMTTRADWYGDLESRILVFSNDPIRPVKPIVVRASVARLVAASPEVVALNFVRLGERYERTIRLFSPYGVRFRIEEISAPGNAEVAPESDTLLFQDEHTIALRWSAPEVEAGPRRDEIYITCLTESGDAHDVRLRVYSIVRAI